MNAPRKPRRKATTEVGRQIMQRERQRLAREQAVLGEQLANEALTARRVGENLDRESNPVSVGISRGIVRRVGAVLAAENVNVPIHVDPAGSYGHQSFAAWTDFRSIHVKYVPTDDVRLLAATLRAGIYHEAGHISWSVPFNVLGNLANGLPADADVTYADQTAWRKFHRAWNCLEDQRMETAVVSDSPRKASYLTPLVMSMHTRTLDAMAANYPLLVWRRYLPRRMRREARKMFVVRHGSKGEMFARECERIVTSYVRATDAATMWKAVEQFHDLLQAMRPLASDMDDEGAGHGRQNINRLPKDMKDRNWDDYLTIPIDSEMENETSTDGGTFIPAQDDDEYDLTDPAVAEHLTEVLIAAWNRPESLLAIRYVSNKPQPQGDGEGEGTDGPGDLSEEQEQEQGEGGEQGDEGQDAPSDDQGEAGDSAGTSGQHGNEQAPDRGESSKADEADDGFDQDDLKKLLQDAEEERNSQGDLDGDMKAFADAQDDMVSKLDMYSPGVCTDGESIAKADALAGEIEDSFHASTMDREPAWVEQQRRGVLNVLRYATHSPGEVEYFKAWTDDEQPGFNLSVSVLLDYSGSMGWANEQLAEAGYACKLACQNLNIPCTISLFDHAAKVLWDANDRVEHMPTIAATGGTDPTMALADLDNQRCDKEKHIVLIMTDGQWDSWDGKGSRRHLSFYKDAGRTIIGFAFGRWENVAMAKALASRGCDAAYAIDDLMVIPRLLEMALIELA